MLQPKSNYRHTDPLIVIVGPMGAGKSTVGKRLAKNLHVAFIDLDQEIEKSTGLSISQIFDIEGEEGFRKRERAALVANSNRKGAVLSTGGGAILSAKNRRVIRNGIVVYLHATPKQQHKRIAKSKHRPILNDGDPLTTLTSLMEVRDTLYRSEADIIVATDGRSIEKVASQVEEKILKL